MSHKSRQPESGTDADFEVNLPGLGALREAVEYARGHISGRSTVRRDGIAGITVAISSVPDGMAGGVLAGVNPLYGLYANMIGPLVGGALSSTRLMVINNTSAVSLVAGQALINLPAEERGNALFLMVVITGLLAIVSGLLGLGRFTRFVSYSVMTGFLAGIAAVLVLSQLSTAAGYETNGANRILQAFDLLTNLDEVHIPSLVIAALTLGLAVALLHTRLSMFSSLVAITIPSTIAALLNLSGVQVVADVGDIPGGIPTLYLPSPALLRSLRAHSPWPWSSSCKVQASARACPIRMGRDAGCRATSLPKALAISQQDSSEVYRWAGP